MKILFGAIGTIAGFFAGLFASEFLSMGSRQDPITSGLVMLFVFGPLGGVAGAFAGTKLAMLLKRFNDTTNEQASVAEAGTVGNVVTKGRADAAESGLFKSSLKSLGIVAGIVAAAVGIYAWYEIANATPWLNPNGGTPLLQFEIRLPAGAPPAIAGDVEFELQTDINTMPGEVHAAKFRNDEGRSLVAGQVELAYRTRHRELEMKIRGQPARNYPIRLTDKAPHTPQFGAWQGNGDGTEIRYRARWPGRD